MPHDQKIIDAIKKHRRGQGAETCIDQPSVGGGESPDLLSWFRPDTGPYETLLDEYKASRADLIADGHKAHRQRAGVGDRRVLIVRDGVLRGPNDPALAPWRQAGWGVTVLEGGSVFHDWFSPRYRNTKDRRTEDRILHDYIRKLQYRLKDLEGTGPQRNGSLDTGLKPYHHDLLDTWLSDCAGLKEIAAILLGGDDRLTRKKALALAHEALRDGAPGFTVVESGQDKFLERVPDASKQTA